MDGGGRRRTHLLAPVADTVGARLQLVVQSLMDVDNVQSLSKKQQQHVEEEREVDIDNMLREVRRHATVQRLSARKSAARSDQAPKYLRAYKNKRFAIDRGEEASRNQLARLIEHAKQRVLEAIVPLKLRRSAELSSPLITMLPAGTRVHVVETKRTPDGGERAHVIIAAGSGSADPCANITQQQQQLSSQNMPVGWVTSRRYRIGESLLRELDADSGVHVSVHSQRSTHRIWPLSFRELQASGRGHTPFSRPKPAWPYVFFSSSASMDMNSAGPVDEHTWLGPDPPKALPHKFAAQRSGSGGPRQPIVRQLVEARAPPTTQPSFREVQDVDSASRLPEGLQSGPLQQTVKAVLKAHATPGSRLSAKSSHAAVKAAADEILALYANPKSNLRGCRVVELEATFDGECARREVSCVCSNKLLV